MKKTVITYGLLAGLLILGLGYATRSFWITPDGKMDMGKGELVGYINMIVSLSMIFFGIRQYRNRHLEGKITFKKAFWVGFQIALIGSLIYVAGWMLYLQTSEIAQTFPEQYLAYMKESWVKEGKTTEEISKLTSQYASNMELFENPFLRALLTLFEILPIAIIIAMISAFILKRK